jgi:dipeptidyl aminopeptidase/acylaminoacyl peptidase
MTDRGDVRDYGKTHIYLGGLAVDTKANRARSLTMRAGTALTLVDPKTNATRALEVPKGATVSSVAWSPTGAQIAYVANFYDASHVYVADVATEKSTQLTKTPLLATLETGVDWTADGKTVAVVLIPDNRGAAPTHGPDGIEDGPQVRMTEGKVIPQRIHWSLLEDAHDKALLKYYTTGQLAQIDVRTKAISGRVTRWRVFPGVSHDRAVFLSRSHLQLRFSRSALGPNREARGRPGSDAPA